MNAAHAQEMTQRTPLWLKLARLGFAVALIRALLWVSAPAIFYQFA